jgi:hypothetical protein
MEAYQSTPVHQHGVSTPPPNPLGATDAESYDDIHAILHVERLHADVKGVWMSVLVLTQSDTLKVLPRANFRKLVQRERTSEQLKFVIGVVPYKNALSIDSERDSSETPFPISYLSATEMLNEYGTVGLEDGEERALGDCSTRLQAYVNLILGL